uniref:SPL-like protein 7 n=1 Tax=Agave tequilana TaxID=386106 RepID=A0AAF0Z2M5_AGATE|nr:SPL-like protein 7 [Agave tequilana]
MAVVRCQVPGCEADIRELKGYHRRHRVCLRCANAPSVVIDGEDRRYCQQCGKFHTLPDFDEGKRSCRRKLERHNRKRRRRPIDLVSIEEKEKGPQADLSTEATYDEEPKEGNGVGCEAVLISKGNTREILLDSDDGHGSPICSLPGSQNMQSNNIMSFAVPVEAHIDEEKDNSKSALSSTICDNRSAYSSLIMMQYMIIVSNRPHII